MQKLRRLLAQAALLVGALALSIGLQAFAQSFNEPTSAPPTGNVAAPLNTSSTAQTKTGGLVLNTGGAINGLIVQSGSVGIGTLTPAAMLNVIGEIGARSYCDENGQNCTSIADLTKKISSQTKTLYQCPYHQDVYYNYVCSGAYGGGCLGPSTTGFYPSTCMGQLTSTQTSCSWYYNDPNLGVQGPYTDTCSAVGDFTYTPPSGSSVPLPYAKVYTKPLTGTGKPAGYYLSTYDDFRASAPNGWPDVVNHICTDLAGRSKGAYQPITYGCVTPPGDTTLTARHNGGWGLYGQGSGDGWCQAYGVDWVACQL